MPGAARIEVIPLADGSGAAVRVYMDPTAAVTDEELEHEVESTAFQQALAADLQHAAAPLPGGHATIAGVAVGTVLLVSIAVVAFVRRARR